MRCFISTPISDEIRKKLAGIQEELKKSSTRMKLVEPEKFHNTLKFLGDINEKQREKAVKAIEKIQEKKFVIRLNRFGAFPNEDYIKVLWAGMDKGEEKLKRIRKNLDEELPGFEEKHDYTPHITIARVKSKPDEVVNRFLNTKISEEMKLKKIRLMKSKLKDTGPEYTEVHSVELE